jgi:hypothetical protein
MAEDSLCDIACDQGSHRGWITLLSDSCSRSRDLAASLCLPAAMPVARS